jgi:hypothetical protein
VPRYDPGPIGGAAAREEMQREATARIWDVANKERK